jgi:hypothetical protein
MAPVTAYSQGLLSFGKGDGRDNTCVEGIYYVKKM